MFKFRSVQRFGSLFTAMAIGMISCWITASGQSATNPIATENKLTGNPRSEWDVTGSGDPSIQGFATEISVNHGETIYFKINTPAAAYRIEVYRLGYYGGRGARKVATLTPSAALPQIQPAYKVDSKSGMVDCGNWTVSASWAVPANAVSGVYIARPVRADTNGASHMPFIVRDDEGNSDLLFQTSDTTWQAYNMYGGADLYRGNGPARDIGWGRAYKVSYNRPFINRDFTGFGEIEGFLFDSEYPMIRWLEANGYNVSYAAGVDTDRRGVAPLLQHKAFLSVGHDEYWSGRQRANVEAALAAGVHLGFFSANEVYWKTRWENSFAGTSTPYRSLVCYKETQANAKIDPSTEWTGTWRDPRFSPPSDGGRPENALSGQISMVNAFRADPMRVSSAEGKARFWRNTGIDTLAAGQSAELPAGVLGFEWDETADNGFSPPGLVRLSNTTIAVDQYLVDFGVKYVPANATHSLSLYRHESGALVFGSGTTQWSWGLDATHDIAGPAADRRVRQATVNILADMGAQPSTLQSDLVNASQTTDSIPPVSFIDLLPGGLVEAGSPIVITGTASDAGGGVPMGVEFSTDGGSTWHPATGAANWSVAWRTPDTPGPVTLMSRATDDSGQIETPGPGVTIQVIPNRSGVFCLWPDTTLPQTVDQRSGLSLELGVRFRPDRNGWIRAIRFYKCPSNAGIHTGHLWTNGGNLLSTTTFAGETGSGWQEAQLPEPVAVAAGAVYVASYHIDSGHFSMDAGYFSSNGRDAAPLHAPANGVSGYNGVYRSGSAAFPNVSGNGNNYWVDVVFTDNRATSPPAAPGGLAVASISGNRVNLKWTDNSTNESSFRIERKTTASGTYAEVAAVGANVTAVSDPCPSLNTEFFYRIRAVNEGGYSAYTPEVSATTFGTPPVAVADYYVARSGVSLVVPGPGVLANDSDAESDPLTAVLVSGPTHGSLVLNANGGFTYTSATSFVGTDSFTYHASDGPLDSNVVTVGLSVQTGGVQLLGNGSFESDFSGWTTGGNLGIQSSPPYAATDGAKLVAFNSGQSTPNGVLSQSFATNPGQTYVLMFDFGVLAFNTKSQNLLVSADGRSNLLSHALTIVGRGGGQLRWLAQSFSFVADSTTTVLSFHDVSTVTDSLDMLLDNVRVFSLAPANSPPVAVADSYAVDQNSALNVSAGGVLSNDSDPQSHPLTAVLDAGPAHGSLALGSNGGFTYTPALGFSGNDAFSYHANDGTLDSNVATVTIAVRQAVSTTLTNGSFESGFQGWTSSGNLTIQSGSPYKSSDGVNLVAFNAAQSTPNGVLSQGFATVAGRAYTLGFDFGVLAYNTKTQVMQVTVGGTSTLLSKTLTITGTGGGKVVWSSQSFPFVADGASCTLTFRDASAESDNLDLLLDNVRLTSTAPLNTAPVATVDVYAVNQGAALDVPAAGVLGNDTDAQEDPLVAVQDSGPSHGSLSLASNGGFVYTPSPGFTGSDSFTYHANDGALNSNVASVIITILPVVTEIVANGSFESGYQGWSASGNMEIQAALPYVPSDGANLVAFNTGNRAPNGVLSQTIVLVPGQSYTLTFDAGVLAYNTNPQTLRVMVTGSASLLSRSVPVVGAGGGLVRWVPQSFTFAADSSSAILTFRDMSLSTNGLDLLLDKVRIVPNGAQSATSATQVGATMTTSTIHVAPPATLPDPVLTWNGNGIRIGFDGAGPGIYLLQRSRDLMTWEPVCEFVLTEPGAVSFRDTTARECRMFYRIARVSE